MAKQNAAKTAPAPKSTASPTTPPGPIAPVALLIDGENVMTPDLIADILAEIGKMGGVTVRRVYGNWAAPAMQPWKKIFDHYELEWGDAEVPPTGPNATDISLTIGAMDLLYSGYKHFCLVTGDRDFVPLVRRLRKDDTCIVVVIGTARASAALKEAASRFLTTDQLLPHATPPAKPRAKGNAAPSAELARLLTEAYHVARQGSSTDWVSLSALGLALKELTPEFEQTYGTQRLSTQLKKFPKLFELRQKPGGNGKIAEARLRSSLQQVS
jgi:hypothetical protein